jgi:ATP-dependent DNA helicase PIF1
MKSSPQHQPIEINEQFDQALHIMEDTNKSIFVTGRAGTGKSTLLSYFRLVTPKKVAVLAPTGVAALNVKGQTIHSFFRFKPGITLRQINKLRSGEEGKTLYQKLDAIVIDEISMVRADLLDCVDKFLRLNGPDPAKPFGGIQMIFIGDLYQLPPVVTPGERTAFNSLYKTPYFYSAKVFEAYESMPTEESTAGVPADSARIKGDRSLLVTGTTDRSTQHSPLPATPASGLSDSFEMEFLELEKIYRQHDPDFINLLNSIRNRSINESGLAWLNSRYYPEFGPSPGDYYVYLTTTNAMAARINTLQLNQLSGSLFTLKGKIEGEFGDEYLPTAIDLQVKTGAQIMLLNNDADGRWVNGSVGKIGDIVEDESGNQIILAELEGGTVEITPFTWEIYRYSIEGGALQSEVIGTFTQYPLMLAWAITIHKSQGKTFEKVVIDIGRGTFAHGQMYVALSRCTTFQGIILKRPILKKHILTDFKVVDFLTRYQYQKAARRFSQEDKIEMILKAIRDKAFLDIVYLKPDDEKSHRTIRPDHLGEMEYRGKTYLGIKAFCLMRNKERNFRVDRILEMKEAQTITKNQETRTKQ